MQFSDLWGLALDHELGSADQSQLFTTVRRKADINRAHKEFARLAKVSLAVDVFIPLVNATAGYNLDTASAKRFVMFGRPPLKLQRLGVATTTSLTLRTSAYMDEARDGWRAAVFGTPDTVVYDPSGGVNTLRLYPVPQIPAGETWNLIVPIQGNAVDMVADTDVPFDGRPDLEPYHWALAHFAAAMLERLRKDPDAEEKQIAKFGAYLEDWNAKMIRPSGANKRVLMQRDYLGESSRRGGITVQGDPRV